MTMSTAQAAAIVAPLSERTVTALVEHLNLRVGHDPEHERSTVTEWVRTHEQAEIEEAIVQAERKVKIYGVYAYDKSGKLIGIASAARGREEMLALARGYLADPAFDMVRIQVNNGDLTGLIYHDMRSVDDIATAPPELLPMEVGGVCEYCGTDHRDANYSLTPCFDSIAATMTARAYLGESSTTRA